MDAITVPTEKGGGVGTRNRRHGHKARERACKHGAETAECGMYARPKVAPVGEPLLLRRRQGLVLLLWMVMEGWRCVKGDECGV